MPLQTISGIMRKSFSRTRFRRMDFLSIPVMLCDRTQSPAIRIHAQCGLFGASLPRNGIPRKSHASAQGRFEKLLRIMPDTVLKSTFAPQAYEKSLRNTYIMLSIILPVSKSISNASVTLSDNFVSSPSSKTV